VTVRGTGRPANTVGYRLQDGTRVPSVTTITGRFKDSGALLRWAWTRGRDGHELYEARDQAAQVGSIVHQWIEDYLHRDAPTEYHSLAADQRELAEGGFSSFLDWARIMNLDVVETEMPLVSEQHRFGGTLDCVAHVSGVLALVDYKTSNAVYREYVAQVAAYRELLRERDGVDAAPAGAYLLRLGKEFGDFNLHSWPSRVLDLGWNWFRHALELYRDDAELKKVA
jgi:hypothetical protein